MVERGGRIWPHGGPLQDQDSAKEGYPQAEDSQSRAPTGPVSAPKDPVQEPETSKRTEALEPDDTPRQKGCRRTEGCRISKQAAPH
jgi:hypothetical protein